MVECRGKCNTVYCDAGCEDGAWQKYHALLCTGGLPIPAVTQDSSVSTSASDCDSAATAGASAAADKSNTKARPAASMHALEAFLEMADAQNDHLRIAAKVVSNTVAEARRREADGEDPAAALAGAWAPWRQGIKALWWDTARKEEGAAGDMSHADFQAEVRSAADKSLQFLKTAMPAAAAEFPALFSQEVWSSILGMLDLNCTQPLFLLPSSFFLLL